MTDEKTDQGPTGLSGWSHLTSTAPEGYVPRPPIKKRRRRKSDIGKEDDRA